MRQQTDSRARSCTSGSSRTMHVSRGPIHLRPHFSVRCPVSCDLIDCYELSGRAGEREHERAKVIAQEVDGDLRQFLIRLNEPVSAVVDKRFENVFTKTNFLTGTSDEMELRSSVFETDQYMLSRMLFENYPSVELTRKRRRRLSDFSDLFSEADMSNRFGEYSEEMVTVLSNAIHGEIRSCKFPNPSLMRSKPIDIREKMPTVEVRDSRKSGMIDIPENLGGLKLIEKK